MVLIAVYKREELPPWFLIIDDGWQHIENKSKEDANNVVQGPQYESYSLSLSLSHTHTHTYRHIYIEAMIMNCEKTASCHNNLFSLLYCCLISTCLYFELCVWCQVLQNYPCKRVITWKHCHFVLQCIFYVSARGNIVLQCGGYVLV